MPLWIRHVLNKSEMPKCALNYTDRCSYINKVINPQTMKLIVHCGDVDSQFEMLKPDRNYSLSAKRWQWQHNLSKEGGWPCFNGDAFVCPVMIRLLLSVPFLGIDSRTQSLSMQSAFVRAINPAHTWLLSGPLSDRCQPNRKSEKIKTRFPKGFIVHWLKPGTDLELRYSSSTPAPKKTGAMVVVSKLYVWDRRDVSHTWTKEIIYKMLTTHLMRLISNLTRPVNMSLWSSHQSEFLWRRFLD